MGYNKGVPGVDGTGRKGPKDSRYEESVEGTVHGGKGEDRQDIGPNAPKGAKK